MSGSSEAPALNKIVALVMVAFGAQPLAGCLAANDGPQMSVTALVLLNPMNASVELTIPFEAANDNRQLLSGIGGDARGSLIYGNLHNRFALPDSPSASFSISKDAGGRLILIAGTSVLVGFQWEVTSDQRVFPLVMDPPRPSGLEVRSNSTIAGLSFILVTYRAEIGQGVGAGHCIYALTSTAGDQPGPGETRSCDVLAEYVEPVALGNVTVVPLVWGEYDYRT